MRKAILFLLGFLLLNNPVIHSQSVTKRGTTAASFLVIDVGPRGNAMGSAYVSVANDITSMYWNPAGIAKLNTFQASFTNSKWIADLSFNYAGLVVPLESFGNIGLNATFLNMGQIERTTIESPDGTGELFDAASYAFGITYARNLSDQFSIGFNAKYVNERLYNVSADGFAADIGALFDTHLEGLMLGMSISNYGTKMQLGGRNLQIQYDINPREAGNNANINANLQTDQFDLPLLFRFGVSMDVLKGLANSNLLISADALHPSDDVEYLNVGGEYAFNNMFFLRAGYKGLFAKDSEQGLNFGGGVRYNIAGTTTFYFDYAYIDFGLLNNVHMFSISFGL